MNSSYFDRAQFEKDYTLANTQKWKVDELEEFRDGPRELRYVLEVSRERVGDIDYAGTIVREVLGQNVEFLVEALFDPEIDPPLPEELRAFVLLRILGIRYSDLSQNPYELAYALRAQGNFTSTEPDNPFYPGVAYGGEPPHDDDKISIDVDDKAWSLRNIRADAAWTLTPPAGGEQGGSGSVIGHLDTGWTEHVDLDNVNIDFRRARDYIDPNQPEPAKDPLGYKPSPGHGTKTGSVIISRGDVAHPPPGTTPPGEVTGVARDSTLLPIRCIRSVVVIFNSDIARAIRYATSVACDVISMSLGGRPMKAVKLALQDAVRSDVLVLCAAGNEVQMVVWPARYPDAIAVTASNASDEPWSRASRGDDVDICAPGQAVWVAIPGPDQKSTDQGDGTSYATAHAAGAAAMWLSYHNRRALEKIARSQAVFLQDLFRASLISTARDPGGWNQSKFGAGILDLEGLLKEAPNALSPNRAYAPHHGDLASLAGEGDMPKGLTRLQVLFGGQANFAEILDAVSHEFMTVFLEQPDFMQAFMRAVDSVSSASEATYHTEPLDMYFSAAFISYLN